MLAKIGIVAVGIAASKARPAPDLPTDDDETLLIQVSSARARRNSVRTGSNSSSLKWRKNSQSPGGWACSCIDWVKIPCDATSDCNGHGTTFDDDASDGCHCACEAGYQLPDCTPIPCDAEDHCNGHGQTVDLDSADGCACSCESGWSGTTCAEPKVCADNEVIEAGGAKWEVRLQWDCYGGQIMHGVISKLKEGNPYIADGYWIKLGKPGYKAHLDDCAEACLDMNVLPLASGYHLPITAMSYIHHLEDFHWGEEYKMYHGEWNWGGCMCKGQGMSESHILGTSCGNGATRYYTFFSLLPDDTPVTCQSMYAADPFAGSASYVPVPGAWGPGWAYGPSLVQTSKKTNNSDSQGTDCGPPESQALAESKEDWDASRPGRGGRCITWSCVDALLPDVTCPEVLPDLNFRQHWSEYVQSWCTTQPWCQDNLHRYSGYSRANQHDIGYGEASNRGNPEEGLWGALVPIPSDFPGECLAQLENLNDFLDALCVTHAYQTSSMGDMYRRTMISAATEGNLTAAAYATSLLHGANTERWGSTTVDGKGQIVVASDYGGVRYFEKSTIPWGPESLDDFRTCSHGHCGHVLCVILNELWG